MNQPLLSFVQDQRGFALVESLATIAFSMVSILVFLSIAYMAFAKLWLDRAAYETSICLSTSVPTFNCERLLRETTAQALPIGRIENVSLNRSSREVQTRFQWRLNETFSLSLRDVRRLPLLGPPAKVSAL